MTHSTTSPAQTESFVTEMTDRMTRIAQELSTWVTTEPRTLAEIEKRTLAIMKDLSTALTMGLCNLAVPRYPEDTIPCSCGQTADYQRAHRVSYERANGPIPDDLIVHHRCGQKDCVNPSHLKALTHREHALLHRGTGRITFEQAAEIRSLKGVVTQVELAKRYGISRRYVRMILNGERL